VGVAATVWAPVEVETVPVRVVEEVKPWSGVRRHIAEEAHSLQAPLVEPEKIAAVEHMHGLSVACRWWHGRAWRGWRRRGRVWRGEGHQWHRGNA
jgi:hypothetical protein